MRKNILHVILSTARFTARGLSKTFLTFCLSGDEKKREEKQMVVRRGGLVHFLRSTLTPFSLSLSQPSRPKP